MNTGKKAEEKSEAKFEVKFTEDAYNDVRKLDGSVKQKLRKIVDKKLSVDPSGYGNELRGPLAGLLKIKFDSHRVIYRILKDHKIVLVCAVGPRKAGDAEDVYNRLESAAATGRLASQVKNILGKIIGVAA
jgi:mRNA interferase RelE/StbE